ncbi:MAG: hypothetical protein ACXACX_07690, partial [Candidatus Hodarchaeales archaeon]
MIGTKIIIKFFFIGLFLLLMIPQNDVLAKSNIYQGENELILKWQKTFDAPGVIGQTFNPLLHKDVISTTVDKHLVLFYEATNKFYLMKIDIDGNFLWNKTYSEKITNIGGVFQTEDNGYLVIGRWFNESRIIWNFLLLKIDSEGNIEWNKTYNHKNYFTGKGNTTQLLTPYVNLETEENFIFSSIGYNQKASDLPYVVNGSLWIWSIFKNGTFFWSESHDFGVLERPYAIKADEDGGMTILCVTTAGPAVDATYGAVNIKSIQGVYLIKLDDLGKEVWKKTIIPFYGVIDSYSSIP